MEEERRIDPSLRRVGRAGRKRVREIRPEYHARASVLHRHGFEAFDVSGSVRRAIFGGGRYDNLLADVGGQPLSGVGFAMGDVVIGIILQEAGLVPEFEPSPAQVLVTVFDEKLWLDSYKLGAELRNAGLKVMVFPEPAKLPKQFKYADKMKMKVAVTVGPDELEKGQVAVKSLLSGEQAIVKREAAVDEIRKHL